MNNRTILLTYNTVQNNLIFHPSNAHRSKKGAINSVIVKFIIFVIMSSTISFSSATTAVVVNNGARNANHRAAAAINNVAVSMLEQGAVRDSMEAFRQAITVMNRGVMTANSTVTTNTTGTGPTNALMDPAEAYAVLKQATQTLLQSRANVDVDTMYQRVAVVESFVHGESHWPRMVDIMEQSLLSATGSNTLAVHPVRFEEVTLFDDEGINNDVMTNNDSEEDSLSPHIHSGIILYNYGLANLCYSYQLANSNSSLNNSDRHADQIQQSQHCATRLLHLSQHILLQFCVEADERCTVNHLGVMHVLLPVTGLVLKTLAAVLIQQDQIFDAHQVLAKVADLVQAIRLNLKYFQQSCDDNNNNNKRNDCCCTTNNNANEVSVSAMLSTKTAAAA